MPLQAKLRLRRCKDSALLPQSVPNVSPSSLRQLLPNLFYEKSISCSLRSTTAEMNRRNCLNLRQFERQEKTLRVVVAAIFLHIISKPSSERHTLLTLRSTSPHFGWENTSSIGPMPSFPALFFDSPSVDEIFSSFRLSSPTTAVKSILHAFEFMLTEASERWRRLREGMIWESAETPSKPSGFLSRTNTEILVWGSSSQMHRMDWAPNSHSGVLNYCSVTNLFILSMNFCSCLQLGVVCRSLIFEAYNLYRKASIEQQSKGLFAAAGHSVCCRRSGNFEVCILLSQTLWGFPPLNTRLPSPKCDSSFTPSGRNTCQTASCFSGIEYILKESFYLYLDIKCKVFAPLLCLQP